MRLRKFNNYGYTKVHESELYIIHFSQGTYYMSTPGGLLLGEKFNFEDPTATDFDKWYNYLRKRAIKSIVSYNQQIQELEDTIRELYDVFDVSPMGEDDE